MTTEQEILLVALVDLSTDVDAGRRYEDAVLALLGRHGGELERRLRTGAGETEVHVIRFATRAGLDAFLVDPERRVARRARRRRARHPGAGGTRRLSCVFSLTSSRGDAENKT
ncbi:hypothetical protein V2I01_18305 [Micromonospora sp. BRA006-A]|nr:hypothetical protein [Micromonospora sp. BRA006-A]